MILDYYLCCLNCDNIFLCFDKEVANILKNKTIDKYYLREDNCEDFERNVHED